MTLQSIVVLTGAGVSAESGLKTFRDNDGLWEDHRIEDVCTPEAFKRDPTTVHRFYNARRAQLLTEAKPNSAHLALAEFANRFNGKFTLITQNVDNLHEQAGSKSVIHMHGELLKVRCCRTLSIYEWYEPINEDTLCPCCDRAGTLRPHIVWFGEIPFGMGTIETALIDCDLFIAIGTSGQVYPAAGFVNAARQYGARTLSINLEPSPNFDENILGAAGNCVPEYFLNTLWRDTAR